MSILVQPTVSNFGESGLPFDDAELVFHLCPDPRLISVPAALVVGQRPVAATLRLGKVFGARGTVGNGFFLPCIGGITPHSCLLPMKQVRQHLGIVHVAGVATTE